MDEMIKKVINSWLRASKELNFKIVAPYIFNSNSGSFECIAYLPDFGSKNGMIIDKISPPSYGPTPGLPEAAKHMELYYSSINIEYYFEFNVDIFKDALIDWGFYGNYSDKPDWV